MEPVEIQIIEVPIIETYVEDLNYNDQGTWVKFACFSDFLLIGRSYPIGTAIQITITDFKSHPTRHRGAA